MTGGTPTTAPKTLEALSARSGISERTISDIERGVTAGDTAAVATAKGQLIAAASILGVLQANPAEWFSGVDEGLKAEVEGLRLAQYEYAQL